MILIAYKCLISRDESYNWLVSMLTTVTELRRINELVSMLRSIKCLLN